MKSFRNPLLMGTLILTLTGFITRIIGFFYRIFISQTFGEEGMGIYQLIAPVMAFSFSLCCGGIQTAVSKYVAAKRDHSVSLKILFVSTLFSTGLSFVTAAVVYYFSDFIAAVLLMEPRTAPLLRILAFSFPLSAFHCCINGYYYGIKNTKLPAFLQFSEQCFRVGSVYFICYLFFKNNMQPPITLAVTGIVIGEASSTLLSALFIIAHFYKKESALGPYFTKAVMISCSQCLKNVLLMAIPLSLNRIIVNLLQSVESVYIPQTLQQFGLSTKEALSVYGVLTGMALSLILFPCAITNSISVLLLPIVSEADGKGNFHTISAAIKKSVFWCTLLGGVCSLLFFVFGKAAGNLLFHSTMAGTMIRSLSPICPFLYITSTLGSILHGLGKTLHTFLINIAALTIRIFCIFFLVPKMGISGYLAGLLLGQVISSAACILCLGKYRTY